MLVVRLRKDFKSILKTAQSRSSLARSRMQRKFVRQLATSGPGGDLFQFCSSRFWTRFPGAAAPVDVGGAVLELRGHALHVREANLARERDGREGSRSVGQRGALRWRARVSSALCVV